MTNAAATDEGRYFPAGQGQTPSDSLPCLHRHWRQEVWHGVIIFVLAFALYAVTAPRTVALEDDGLFIGNLHFFGVAHPPGYPIHTFLGGIFYHLLPFLSPAYKAHLFSGFAAAAACVALYVITLRLIRGRMFAYLAALAFAASKTFWSQAIIAEVYTLHAFFFFTALALALSFAADTPQAQKWWTPLAVVYGLGLANHHPLLILASSGLALLVIPRLRRKVGKLLFAAAVALAVCAPFYGWMVWRSYSDVPANFYGFPIADIEHFWYYLSRAGYSGGDFRSHVGWVERLGYLRFLATETVGQYTVFGFAFVIIGFAAMLRSAFNWLCVCLLATCLTSSVLLIFIRDLELEYTSIAVFRVYHVAAYGIMAIWLAVGAAVTVDFLKTEQRRRRFIAGGLALCLVTAPLLAHWSLNNRRDDRFAHDLAMKKLTGVRPNAVVFTHDDTDFPIGYLYYVEGVRSDLKLYNDQGLGYAPSPYAFTTPDFAPEDDPQAANKKDIIRNFVHGTFRPIYFRASRRELFITERHGYVLSGFWARSNRASAGGGVENAAIVKEWLRDNLGQSKHITDLWTKLHHYSTVLDLMNTVFELYLLDDFNNPEWEALIRSAGEEYPYVRIAAAYFLLANGGFDEDALRRELAWIENFQPTDNPFFDTQASADVYHLRALLIARVRGEEDSGYAENLRAAVERYPSANNPALAPLLDYYDQQGMHCEYLDTAALVKFSADHENDTAAQRRQTAMSACKNTN